MPKRSKNTFLFLRMSQNVAEYGWGKLLIKEGKHFVYTFIFSVYCNDPLYLFIRSLWTLCSITISSLRLFWYDPSTLLKLGFSGHIPISLTMNATFDPGSFRSIVNTLLSILGACPAVLLETMLSLTASLSCSYSLLTYQIRTSTINNPL